MHKFARNKTTEILVSVLGTKLRLSGAEYYKQTFFRNPKEVKKLFLNKIKDVSVAKPVT